MAIYRIHKQGNYTVMSNTHLRDERLSLTAIGLLSKMLSYQDGWRFSTSGLVAMCREGASAIKSALRELEQYGYLRRSQGRSDAGRFGETLFEIFEVPVDPRDEKPQAEKPQAENRPTVIDDNNRNIYIYNPIDTPYSKDIRKSIRNTDKRNTKLNDGGNARARETYKRILEKNVRIDLLKQDKTVDAEILDELMKIMLDTVCSTAETVRVNHADVPQEVVKSQLLKLDDYHMRFAIDTLKTAPPLRNVRAYMLTVLYNAPDTMDAYYMTQANRFAGG